MTDEQIQDSIDALDSVIAAKEQEMSEEELKKWQTKREEYQSCVI